MSSLRDLVDLVNPEQGTASIHTFSTGNTSPLVALPFGMTHWSPQTEESNRFYHPAARQLQGVRATHQPSPWIGDYGHFTIMPQVGRRFLPAGQRASAFRRQDTVIRPHFFRTHLVRYQTTLEMTPSERCACLRFTFPETGDARIILEFFEGESHVEIHPEEGVITGYTRANSGGVPEGYALYFAADLNCPLQEVGLFQGRQVMEGEREGTGNRLGAYAGLRLEGTRTAVMQVATSFISVEQAQHNLAREMGVQGFDAIRDHAQAVWNEQLNRIQIEGATDEQERTFYTSLYRALLYPRRFHELDDSGEPIHYSPYDGKVHPGVMVTDNGFWDTHRTVYPFLSIFLPDRLSEMIEGWINAAKEGGWFPKWASPGYRACMIGTHLDVVVADAFVKGIRDWDVEAAYAALRKDATEVGDQAGNYGRRGIREYAALGYVPADEIDHAAARTQDFAYNDFGVAQVAQGLGKEEDARAFGARALNYRNTFDPAVGFMRGRNRDGSWEEPFDEFCWGGAHIEGSAWQCTWAVPHDPAGLIELMGGDQALVAKLDRMLELPPIFEVGPYNVEIHEMTEMAAADFGQYAHSNQPVHHVLYLYTCAGAPEKTQHWVRRVLNELYSPYALAGDEDNGEMSCWYLFSALGFYPLCPGHPSYVLGSPLFRRATVDLPNGNTLVVEAENNSPENVYVQRVELNGQALQRLFLTHEEIAAGGTLGFVMGAQPKPALKEWERPFSLSSGEVRVR